MSDSYLYVIVALLPLAAVMLTVQVNPYHALVIRGILGGIAAMVYAVLGAADVALTEALVGTMLAITLYAVAVRSSLVMRLGVLQDDANKAQSSPPFDQLIDDLRAIAGNYHLRLEIIPYADVRSLNQALLEKEVHLTWWARSPQYAQDATENGSAYHAQIRVRRLYEILQAELTSPVAELTYVPVQEGETH
jgi:putative multicomponent Na+:H+ antiporter subunit B